MTRLHARTTPTAILSALVASGLALVFAGCGGGGGGPETTEASFCASKAAAECKQLKPKCMFDEPTCVNVRTTACTALGASQKSATRIFKAKNTGACLSRVNSILSKPAITPADWQLLADTCNRVWEGDGKVQSPCTNAYDCLLPNICDKGYCAAKAVVGATDFCTDPGKVCPAMQFCRKKPAPSTFWGCEPRAGSTLPCGPQADMTTIECAQDLRCLSGTCASRLAGLTACSANSDCISDLCDPFAHQCVMTIGFALGTASCNAFVGTVTPGPDAAVTPTPDAAAGN